MVFDTPEQCVLKAVKFSVRYIALNDATMYFGKIRRGKYIGGRFAPLILSVPP